MPLQKKSALQGRGGRFWRTVDSLTSVSKRLGVLAVAGTVTGTVIGYWIAFLDRAETRHEHAWSIIREAIKWSEQGKWGNVGQIDAIQTLTGDCNDWWRQTFLEKTMSVIFSDCQSLKSLPLLNMEFGGLQAAGADLSYGYYACSNFTNANLRNAKLQGIKFQGANMTGVDFSGSRFNSDTCFRLTDVSMATFDDGIGVEILKEACVQGKNEKGEPQRQEIKATSEALKKIAREIRECPPTWNRCEVLRKIGWDCGSPLPDQWERPLPDGLDGG